MSEFAKSKNFINLKAISSMDGRFRGNIEDTHKNFSEYATMRFRVMLEIKYLIALSKELEEIKISKPQEKILHSIYEKFSLKDAKWIEDKDYKINHDTKSAEYFIQKKLKENNLEYLRNWIHFGLTSADIDSNALVLSIKQFEEDYFSNIRKNILKNIRSFIRENSDSVFLARTHGKKAVPTSMSKEFMNFFNRLEKIDNKLNKFRFEGKVAGAVGNMNALILSFPDKDWEKFSKSFIKTLYLESNMFSTQILPYDNIVEYLHYVKQFNMILIDLSKDIWLYISIGLLTLKVREQEVGSSTMAHKVNPISFEGCEANLIFANGSLDTLSNNLTNNRLQRDLTDKYMTRFIGESLVISSLGYTMIEAGLGQVEFNQVFAKEELDNHWECLSEAVQTILRRDGYSNAYEKIKDLTRGKSQSKEEYLNMISQLKNIPDSTREELNLLSPYYYIGWANSIKL